MALPVITPAPRLLARQMEGSDACNSIGSFEQSCDSATPGFNTLSGPAAASCLCYSSTVWQPYVFDYALTVCESYFKTADPNAYSQIIPISGQQCENLGNVAGATSTFLGSSRLNPTSSACSAWLGLLTSCAAAQITTDFYSLPPHDQASCLCYVGTSYAPSVYDGYEANCASFYSTDDPSKYTALFGSVPTTTFCADQGDVRASAGSGATPSPSSTVSQPAQSTASTGGAASLNLTILGLFFFGAVVQLAAAVMI